MKYIKKIIAILSFFAFVNANAENVRILCTTFPVYQMTQNVAANAKNVTVDIMIPSSMGCPHDYALNPEDMKKLNRADILVINGLKLEEFLGAPLKKANSNIKVIDSSFEMKDLMEYKDENNIKNINPHIFASPKMAALMVMNISKELSKLNPDNSKIYEKNTAVYFKKLMAVSEKTIAAVKTLSNNRIITQHGVFDYYARDCGVEVVGVIQAHGGEDPSAAQVIKIIKNIKEKNAGAIFTEPQYPDKLAKKISKETKILCGVLDPCATGPDNAPVDYYEKVMNNNIEVLVKYLKR